MRNIKSVLITLLFAISSAVMAKSSTVIDRVEPAFWWAGMVHPELQLLVHGDDISNLNATINYDGVTLDQTIKVENPNYLFLNLTLAKDVKAGSFPIEFKNTKGKVVFTYTYELKERRKDSAAREGFNKSDIMYLITPDRWVNGDESNDKVPSMREDVNRSLEGGRHGGDIQGLVNSLDYIDEMGFTAIWVNPLLENDMDSYSYHGYSTTDYYKIDAHYGSNEDYVNFVAEANKKGIKIIMDMIENHCGLNHWWTNDLPTKDWYHYSDMKEKPVTSHQRVTVADPYATETDKARHSDGWFVQSMPDLNQKNPLLANYLIQNSIWWIEYANLGGIRQDTYPYPDPDFMTEWTRRIMQEYPNFNIVGEEWTSNPALVSRWQKGKENQNGYVSYCPSMMDFPIQEALINSLNKEAAQYTQTFNEVYEKLAMDFLYSDPANLVTFPDNHDTPRYWNQINEDFDLYKMGLVYIYTTRGIPQIFYGTEILMGVDDETQHHNHGLIREDFPGGWKGDKVNAFTGEGLTAQQKEAQEFMKKLTNFRKNNPVLHTGELKHFSPYKEVYVMFRYNDSTKIMSIFNKNKQETKVDLGHYQEVLKGATKATDALTGKTYDLSNGTITVPAVSGTMLIVE
ncbi:glycoside hydrolase family 13 protein [Flammeovirga sp. SubArs3]|uniref:glycoside hydrolase family 13 protein n=1 Tax=Flammeovirga sp. SubArs3 TaxID=2995316 RepID=UPI00248C26BB|nr:glycoside hydrolase family 13 protein [Flammeovirga sp. SubArs3]